ncbi:hypothetical protein HYPSUDRAFT_196803 [Hypholoma sublateritium FD-334 SS-4]|uniref:T6SS Phospholipase effector Tle1-like catalytic domain-containing protein n=1 Tax=Hypholoma sublateritium (strain FD-334 SS-4) TaxID=945553 RepID=A0A0D2PMA4_HYPSF|nr:hypothetical protein HYPSUDRAFT_196803 [Hypholoma sublateritium FD-334 SS-4]
MSDADSHSTHRSSLLLRESEHGSSTRTSPSPSPSRSARRSLTAPDTYNTSRAPKFKRIVVLCDGTWENGVDDPALQKATYTNVMRLARALHHEDHRPKGDAPVTQVVYYQSGVGSADNLYSKYVEGATGDSLPHKVEEAYAFISQNFNPGDEIYLFGFSRGAYTARMIATLIGEIGILTRSDMDKFGYIFDNFQKFGICDNKKEKDALEAILAPYRDPHSEGHKRAALWKDKFTIKFIGVWDTVGSLGLPREIDPIREKRRPLFGLPDCMLGEHIEAAYQALAINEMREDFVCAKFYQTAAGKNKGQILKQTWFSGCHADIGGGYLEHDLSDLSLIWMVANVQNYLFIDEDYLRQLIRPVAPWGEQKPHNSRTGVFELSLEAQRTLPSSPNEQTNETVHSSVVRRMQGMSKLPKALEGLKRSVESHPSLVEELLELEKRIYDQWPHRLSLAARQAYELKLQQSGVERPALKRMGSVFNSLRRLSQGSSGFLTRWIWIWRTTTTTTSAGTTIRTTASTSVTVQPTNTVGSNESNSSSSSHAAKKQFTITQTKVTGQNKEGLDTIANSTTIVVQSPTS